jgi:secreted trypsin-like serine protease
VAAIPLAASTDTALYAAGVNAIVSGWGTTSSNGAVSYVLRKVTVPLVANATCNTNYGGGITDRMLCAGKPQGGVDSCQGDSGGPLIANSAGVMKLIGVVSWGEGCAAAGKPGVYASVINLRSWIAGYVPLTNQATAVVPSVTAVKTATAIVPSATAAKTATAVKTATVAAKTATAVKTATVAAKTATAVKTATIMATATTAAGTGYTTRVGNGNFEAGHTAWTEASTNYPNLIINDTRVKARSGTYYAWLAGANNETSRLSQSLSVQADAPYLRVYYMLTSSEACGNRYDTAQITINGVTVPNGDMELCASKTVNTWQAFTIDLTASIGKTVTLAITATTDDSALSHLWIDDVGFVRTATESIGYYGAVSTTAQKNISQITQR